MSRTVIIYHADCWDGTVAALCAWFKFQGKAEYVAMAYQTQTPWERYAGADVYFVDFSWPVEALEALATVANRVVVLDHHKNMGEQLMAIPRHAPGRCEIEVVFNNEKSGARLAFEHFEPKADCLALLVDYVEDRDLWRRRLYDSKEFTAALNSFPRTIEGALEALECMNLATDPIVEMSSIGSRILAYQNNIIAALTKETRVTTFAGIDNIPVCNVPQGTALQSEVGDHLVTERFPGCLFAAVYGDTADGKRRWSLRSRKNASGELFDVSIIARKYGGNGHAAAAGFCLPADVWPA